MHFHYALFAQILHDLAKTIVALPSADVADRLLMLEGAKALYLALDHNSAESATKSRRGSELTADEELRLLHLME